MLTIKSYQGKEIKMKFALAMTMHTLITFATAKGHLYSHVFQLRESFYFLPLAIHITSPLPCVLA